MLHNNENEINSNRDTLVNEWFYNLLTSKGNNTVLLLHSSKHNIAHNIVQLLSNLDCPRGDYIICNESDFNRFKSIKKNKNIILILAESKNILSLLNFRKMIGKSFLFVGKDSGFYLDMKQYINNNNSNSVSIPDNKKYLYFIEEINPYHIIKSATEIEIKNYLNFIIHNTFLSLSSKKSLSLLINDTTYTNDDYLKSTYCDIETLKTDNILTSRLAVVIYRIALLDFTASPTKIGRYFHEMSGSKSKTFNKNNKRITTINYDLAKKNFKAYDLSVNEAEIAIRKEIAQNLIILSNGDLDPTMIAEATKLTIKEVGELI